MKTSIQHIVLIVAAAIAFSCSDQFINETLDISGVAVSAIIISPEWESDNYQFQCENAENADFSIESKPEWLSIDNNSGTFSDGMATVTCKANELKKFVKTGIYIDQMLVIADGKKYAVPLYYINEGDPKVSAPVNFEISYTNNNSLTIGNTGDGILLWEVIAMPDWLALDTAQLNINNLMIAKNANVTIPFVFNPNAAITGIASGTIVLAINDKSKPTVTINITADFGSPQLNYYSYNTTIDFGSTTTSKSIYFSNQGNGFLTWSFENLPEWLSVSKQSGTLSYYDSENITLTCDRAKLTPGQNSAVIRLVSNDPINPTYQITISARAPGSNTNVKAIEGNIVDACYNKNTDILYYATSQPNKLIAYNTLTKSIAHEITLSKTPTCLAISEDFTKATVGHGGLISVVNLGNFEVTKTIELDFSVYDIAWAEDDWFCYTKTSSPFSSLLWINTSTLESYNTNDNDLDENSTVKKVPTQPFIIASRHSTSPSGFFAYSIATKAQKSYSHMDLTNFWFTEDGKYTFGRNCNVYRTSSATNSNNTFNAEINSIGRLNNGSTYYYSIWIDHSAKTHNIWAILGIYYPNYSSNIYQFEDNDYTLVKTYTIDDLHQPDSQTAAYEVQAHYVFANGAGTELSVLRKGTGNNNWSIEFINVQ